MLAMVFEACPTCAAVPLEGKPAVQIDFPLDPPATKNINQIHANINYLINDDIFTNYN